MNTPTPPTAIPIPLGRALLVAGGVLLLMMGMSAGLTRLGWPMPTQVAAYHGPLMICGFLGALISLERAVALSRSWAYVTPAAAILGNILLLIGVPGNSGIITITVASLLLVVLFGLLLWCHRTFYLAVMAVGSVNWWIGNLLWLAGWRRVDERFFLYTVDVWVWQGWCKMPSPWPQIRSSNATPMRPKSTRR